MAQDLKIDTQTKNQFISKCLNSVKKRKESQINMILKSIPQIQEKYMLYKIANKVIRNEKKG